MIIMAHIPYPFWRDTRYVMIGIAFFLLVMVLIPGIGTAVNGAKRWIRFGNLGIQPSELARFSLIIFLAGYLTQTRRLDNLKEGLLPCLGVIFGLCALVIVEPDVGMTVFIATTSTILLIAGGVKPRKILPIFLIVLVCVSIIAVAKSPYTIGRITSFVNPGMDVSGKRYQLNQSLIALGSGGLTGVGLGESIQKLFFLPELQSDSIFPIIGEELGFIGTAYIVATFLAFIFFSWHILRRIEDPFGVLLALGITIEIVLQAIINISVAVGIIPTKGMPLPFISFGGSSLFFTMLKIGILINISERNKVPQSAV
jgi:cell division protein FtsW